MAVGCFILFGSDFIGNFMLLFSINEVDAAILANGFK